MTLLLCAVYSSSAAAHSFDCPVLPSANKRRKQPTALNPSPPTLHLLHIPLAPIIYIRKIRMVFGKKQPAHPTRSYIYIYIYIISLGPTANLVVLHAESKQCRRTMRAHSCAPRDLNTEISRVLGKRKRKVALQSSKKKSLNVSTNTKKPLASSMQVLLM